jgi:putative membrane protein
LGGVIMRVVFVLLLLLPTPALAHEGGAIPSDVWTHWNTDPLLLAALLLPLLLYLRGVATYRVAAWRTAAFSGGIVVAALALLSPLEAVSHALFAAHMTQHLLLMVVAAPLLAFSRPLAPLLRGLPSRWGRGFGALIQSPHLQVAWRRLTQPLVATLLHIAALWVWHVPRLYEAALDKTFVHALEHGSFLLTAMLFWWALRYAADYGARLLCLFVVMMASGILGVLLTFATSVWYSSHTALAGAWGLSPLQDQQLAGLLMWIPAGVVYVVAAALLLGAWITTVGAQVAARERQWVQEQGHA